MSCLSTSHTVTISGPKRVDGEGPPMRPPTLQGLLGAVQLLLLLGQLDAQLGGREQVGRAALVALLQVPAQHVLHLPQQVHLLLELGHLLAQEHWGGTRERRER